MSTNDWKLLFEVKFCKNSTKTTKSISMKSRAHNIIVNKKR